MMGLIEQKCVKYTKILITKARCIVHKEASLLVNVSTACRDKRCLNSSFYIVMLYYTDEHTCDPSPPFLPKDERMIKMNSNVTFATFSASCATQNRILHSHEIIIAWNYTLDSAYILEILMQVYIMIFSTMIHFVYYENMYSRTILISIFDIETNT